MLVLACNVAVDGDTGGLSGMGGPGGASDASGAGDANGDATAGDTTAAAADTATPATDTGDSQADDDTGATTDPDSATTGDGATTQAEGSTTTNGGAPGDPLDPGLDVPDGGQVCTTPGSLGECPALEVCRFNTTEQGLCESCDVCGNLGAPCAQGTDCDILFACFDGQCTNICPLGTFFCGPIEDCLDVGHPTHGVCAPF